jgi:hypothetical protein
MSIDKRTTHIHNCGNLIPTEVWRFSNAQKCDTNKTNHMIIKQIVVSTFKFVKNK